MKQSPHVIVIGELNVDLILNRIDGFAEIGKEKLAAEMTLTLGSSSAIFASNLSSLGTNVSFLGKIGQDSFGDLVIESLASSQVKTDLIIRDKNLKTGVTIVLNYDNDRAMVTHAGAMEKLTITDLPKDKLAEANHLHFSSFFLQPGIRKDVSKMFALAKSLGLTTSLDTQWDPEERWDIDLKNVLPNVDVFLPNMQELLHLTGATSLEDAHNRIQNFANIVAVKKGEKGSVVFTKNGKTAREAFLNKQVVDAIGAGDSFNAGFIHKYISGASLEVCQTFGNLIGAVSTTAAGGTSAFKDYASIMRTAKKKFGYTDS